MVSFLFQVVEGRSNPWLEIFENSLPVRGVVSGVSRKAIRENAVVFLTKFSGPLDFGGIATSGGNLSLSRYYTYEGSLTTPPCSEPVEWVVFAETLVMSSEQLALFTKAIQVEGNFRPPQPLNNRCIRDCSGNCAGTSNFLRTAPDQIATMTVRFAIINLRRSLMDLKQEEKLKAEIVRRLSSAAKIDDSRVLVSLVARAGKTPIVNVTGVLGIPKSNLNMEYLDTTKKELVKAPKAVIRGIAAIPGIRDQPGVAVGNLSCTDPVVDVILLDPSFEIPAKDTPSPTPVRSFDEVRQTRLPSWERPQGKRECPCVGIAGLNGTVEITFNDKVYTNFPVDMGASCAAWDDGRFPGRCENTDQEPGIGNSWCAQPFCFVDPCNCDLLTVPRKIDNIQGASYLGNDLYYSYETCEGYDFFSEERSANLCFRNNNTVSCLENEMCYWSRVYQKCIVKKLKSSCERRIPYQIYGHPDCRCVGIRNLPGTTTIHFYNDTMLEYPASTGSVCESWDDGLHLGACTDQDRTIGNGTDWCAARWCYVDPCYCSIPTDPENSTYLPYSSRRAHRLAVSYATCTDAAMTDSPDEETGKSMLCNVLKTPELCTDLGAKDCTWAVMIKRCVPIDLLPMCSKDWGIGNAKPNFTTLTTTFYVHGNPECKCIGISGLSGETTVILPDGKMGSYPAEVGSKCDTWDDGVYPGACETANQVPGLGADWCSERWCFVNPCLCNLTTSPRFLPLFSDVFSVGRNVAYSYETCNAVDYTSDVVHENSCRHMLSAEGCNARKSCTWSQAVTGEPRCDPTEVVETCEVKPEFQIWGHKSCPCVGFSFARGRSTVEINGTFIDYPSRLGSSCESWDNERLVGQCVTEADIPGVGQGWCVDRWCFVDPCNCGDSSMLESGMLPELYYQGRRVMKSYRTCADEVNFTESERNMACVHHKSRNDCKKLNCSWTGSRCVEQRFEHICLDVNTTTTTTSTQNWGSKTCRCIGITGLRGRRALTLNNVNATYPADLGSYCKAWDNGLFPGACVLGTQNPGLGNGWCGGKWCFVDPCDCDLDSYFPRTFSALPDDNFQGRPLYYSYGTCGSRDFAGRPFSCQFQRNREMCASLPNCAWDASENKCADKTTVANVCDLPVQYYWAGVPACRCVGIGMLASNDKMSSSEFAELYILGKFYKYPRNVGSTCSAWDDGRWPGSCTDEESKPGKGKGWCIERWCFVDPCKCSLPTESHQSLVTPGATIQGRPLHISYATCGGQIHAPVQRSQICSLRRNADDCESLARCFWNGASCHRAELRDICKPPVPQEPALVDANDSNTTNITNGNLRTPVMHPDDAPDDSAARVDAKELELVVGASKLRQSRSGDTMMISNPNIGSTTQSRAEGKTTASQEKAIKPTNTADGEAFKEAGAIAAVLSEDEAKHRGDGAGGGGGGGGSNDSVGSGFVHCNAISCGHGYIRRPGGAGIAPSGHIIQHVHCAHEPCDVASDVDFCCIRRATCATLRRCPSGFERHAEASTMFCHGAACDGDLDRYVCCYEASQTRKASRFRWLTTLLVFAVLASAALIAIAAAIRLGACSIPWPTSRKKRPAPLVGPEGGASSAG
eukprot:TRINITY_DN27529_c0_g1_i1.p1 TRINITY_DN27529_c0_g1~~TRINITY_DN27529_c0_g1_i1.p1  ORF type:complete len:1769 (+),score=232.36 TRINITY_DN27529_c0_g1_i1:539-5308(+)